MKHKWQVTTLGDFKDGKQEWLTETIEAFRCCLNAGWVMFYINANDIVAAFPVWRVREIKVVAEG